MTLQTAATIEGSLSSDLVVENINRAGYAASDNGDTSLHRMIPEPCMRAAQALQGFQVPELMGAADGLHAAGRIARSRAIESGEAEFGYLFRLEIHARIAIPSPRIASKMATSEGIDIWNALRPFAEEKAFHGVQFPFGLVIFQIAQDDVCIQEEYIWRVKSSGIPLEH